MNNQSSPNPLPTQTSRDDVSNHSTPNYQNLSHSPPLNDILDNRFDSTDSDFEMLSNPIYYSNSSDNSSPQIYLRIADSPNTSHTYPNNPQTVPTYTRAPHSPNKLRSLPIQNYNSSTPNVSFPPEFIIHTLFDLLTTSIVFSLNFYTV